MTENHQNRNSATMELVDPNSAKICQRRPPPQVFIYGADDDDDVDENDDIQTDSDQNESDENVDGAEALAILALAAEYPAIAALRNHLLEISTYLGEKKVENAEEDFFNPGLDYCATIENIERLGQLREELIKKLEAVGIYLGTARKNAAAGNNSEAE